MMVVSHGPVASLQVYGVAFVIIFVVCVIVSGAISGIFRKQVRGILSLASVFLNTPIRLVKIVVSSESLIEVQSMFRGLVGVWVLCGVLLITAYQIALLEILGRTEIAALQPGAVFSSGLPTSTVSTPLNISLVLFQTPITCDQSQFVLFFHAYNTPSNGAPAGPPTTCVEDPNFPSVNLTFAFPSSLNFTSSSRVQFSAASINGSPLFSHGVFYELQLSSINMNSVTMSETLTNDPKNLLTGDVVVDLDAIPTEYLYDSITQTTGFGYSYSSSTATSVSLPSSAILQVSFDFAGTPSSFYQIRNIEAISLLQFVNNIFGLAAAVILTGSFFANVASLLYLRVTGSSGRESTVANKDHLVPLI